MLEFFSSNISINLISLSNKWLGSIWSRIRRLELIGTYKDKIGMLMLKAWPSATLLKMSWKLFRPQVCWDDIVTINHYIRGIIHFGARLLRHDFVLKRHLGGWREEGVFKQILTSSPKRCRTILGVSEQASRVKG